MNAPKRPNVLLIMTDEHHALVSGFAGDEVVDTACLDRLAERSVVGQPTNRDLRVRQAESDRAGAAVAFERIAGDESRCLGHPVDLVELLPRDRLELLAHRNGKRRGASQAASDRTDVGPAERYLGNRPDRRGHTAGKSHAMTLADAPEIRDHRRVSESRWR